MNYFDVNSKAVEKMDKVVDGLGIQWQRGGSDIRGVMLRAVQEAFKCGRELEVLLQKQRECKHDYVFNTQGGECRFCGITSGMCSSD